MESAQGLIKRAKRRYLITRHKCQMNGWNQHWNRTKEISLTNALLDFTENVNL